VRNNDYARGAVRTIVNNVVGKGIKLQSQVKKRRGGKLDEDTNAKVEELWATWNKAKYCHTAGKLCFENIERLIMRSVVESGEVLIRFITKSFDGSPVPLALEIIEADQLYDDFSSGPAGVADGHQIRMGVEVDEWKRPIAYWVYRNHPGDYQYSSSSGSDRLMRIPAEEILHIYVCDRPGQTRGIPWFHSALQRLRNVGGYEEAELIAARAQAAVMGFIETPEPASTLADDSTPTENLRSLEPGAIELLAPGEKFSGFAPTRPGNGFDPFIKLMLRGFATGIGMSYEALSKDLSQVNYSSARIGMLDDRDNWRILQGWLTNNFHYPVFERWLELAVLSGAINLPNYELNSRAYCCPKFTPRGFDWVDPAKEINASKEAIRAGLSTLSNELAAKGIDVEELFEERRRELDLAQSLDLNFDTDPQTISVLETQ
jgi:lambda family phage portal protein